MRKVRIPKSTDMLAKFGSWARRVFKMETLPDVRRDFAISVCWERDRVGHVVRR